MSKKNEKVARKSVKKSSNGKISNSKGKSNLTKQKLELQELKDKHLRLKAEFENFRRRKAEEISQLLQFEGESVIKGFLPIIDDLGRMINSSNSSDESLSDGIELVNAKIENFFEKLNVESFGSEGDQMDPTIHDAMLTQKDKAKEDDIILNVFEKGYTYRDKVIRHAKVIVNKK